VTWTAEIVEDQPDQRIAWRTAEESNLHHSGAVRFERAPGGRGATVTVEMDVQPPGGRAAASLVRLLRRIPEEVVEQDLRRFKQVLEVGEVVRSDASIHSGIHPARPPAYAHG
jgi:uncharacterized membrane protein